MERRPVRFTPGSEDLERRALLSTVASPTAQTNPLAPAPTTTTTTAATGTVSANSTTNQNVQNVLNTRNQRVNRLPAYLRSISNQAIVPDSIATQLQNAIRPLIGALRSPSWAASQQFNMALRTALSKPSLSLADARTIDNAFAQVMSSARVPAGNSNSMRGALSELARSNIDRGLAPWITTNDYAIVLQTALGVGRPIRGYTPPPIPST